MRRARRITLCIGAAVVIGIAGAAKGETPASGQEPVYESVPLRLANRTVFEFRAPLLGHGPRARAAAAERQLEAALQSDTPTKVTTKATSEGTAVLADGKLMFLVAAGDLGPGLDESTESAANQVAEALGRAIAEYREQRNPRKLAIAVGLAALLTFVYLGVLRGLFILDRWASRRVLRAVAERVQRVEMRGVKLFDPAHFLTWTRRLFASAIWAVGAAVTYAWLLAFFEQFPYTRPWAERLEGHLIDLIAAIARAILGALPGLVLVVIIAALARLIIQAAGALFNRVEDGRVSFGWLDANTARPTRRIFGFVVWLFALALAYPYLPGAESDAFKGVSVLVGLMVSIGASGIVGQAASGLILMYTGIFRVGEFVRIGETEGTVNEVGMFSTRVTTGLGVEVMLPNSFVLANTSKNYSRAVAGSGFVLDIAVTIGYSVPWRQVHAMLEEAARHTPEVEREPEPFVRQTALSDFYVEYHLVAYTLVKEPKQRIEVLSKLRANIQDLFNEHGVQIMSPHYMTDPAEPQVIPKARWYLAPAQPPAPSRGGQREPS